MINVEVKYDTLMNESSLFSILFPVSSFKLFVMNLSIRNYPGSGIGKEISLYTANSVIPGGNTLFRQEIESVAFL